MALQRSVLQKQQQSFCDVKKKVVIGLYAIPWKTKQTSSCSSLQSHAQQQLKLIVSCMTISISQSCGGILTHTSLQRCFSWLRFVGFFFKRRSLKFPPKHFNQVQPLQHAESFLFQPFGCRFAALLRIIALSHDPVWSIIYYTEELMVSWSGSKTIPRLLMTKNKLNQDQYQLMHTGY